MPASHLFRKVSHDAINIVAADARKMARVVHAVDQNRQLVTVGVADEALSQLCAAADEGGHAEPAPQHRRAPTYVAHGHIQRAEPQIRRSPVQSFAISAELARTLQDYGTIAGGRRVTVTVAFNEAAPDVLQFTFRPGSHGLAEERAIRGMHPLTGQRLDLWRLSNFHLVIAGGLLLVVVLFAPGGLIGWLYRLAPRSREVIE